MERNLTREKLGIAVYLGLPRQLGPPGSHRRQSGRKVLLERSTERPAAGRKVEEAKVGPEKGSMKRKTPHERS